MKGLKDKIKELTEIILELTKLVAALDELSIRIISLVGWIAILIYIITK